MPQVEVASYEVPVSDRDSARAEGAVAGADSATTGSAPMTGPVLGAQPVLLPQPHGSGLQDRVIHAIWDHLREVHHNLSSTTGLLDTVVRPAVEVRVFLISASFLPPFAL
jgi:hypothetical protein